MQLRAGGRAVYEAVRRGVENHATLEAARHARAVAWILVALVIPASALAHRGVEDDLRALDGLIAEQPGRADLLLRRGELHRTRGDLDEALEDYRRARRLDPRLDQVALCEGRLWLGAGSAQRALEALERFLSSRPADPTGLELRGDALAQLGRAEEAAETYSRSIRSTIESGGRADVRTFLSRARAYASLGGDGIPRALASVEEGLLGLGRPIALEIEALDLEVRLGLHDDAVARARRLEKASSFPAYWQARRGRILLSAGRVAEAHRAFAEARESLEALPGARRRLPAVRGLEQELTAESGSIDPPQQQAGPR